MGTLVRDVLALKGDEYPIRVQVDDPEGVILEENCYESISDGEEFVKTHYGNVPGVTAYVYELKEVYKVVEDMPDTWDDGTMSTLMKKHEELLAKLDELLKERK